MPTSNSNPQPSAATDSPLGAPAGNEPYKTVRAGNTAQDDGKDVAASDDAYATKRMGNVSQPSTEASSAPAAKPAQEA